MGEGVGKRPDGGGRSRVICGIGTVNRRIFYKYIVYRNLRAGARRARASLVSDVEKEWQTVSDYTAGRYLVSLGRPRKSGTMIDGVSYRTL